VAKLGMIVESGMAATVTRARYIRARADAAPRGRASRAIDGVNFVNFVGNEGVGTRARALRAQLCQLSRRSARLALQFGYGAWMLDGAASPFVWRGDQ
jgi:hypothetical protein